MKTKIVLWLCLLVALTSISNAQIKIGNNPNTINNNSILELESNNKGLLPPRVALLRTDTIAPLEGSIPVGMLVYSIGGSIADGYYFWDGNKWVAFSSNNVSPQNIVTKTANATLIKTETMVFAKNDITITLPVITNSDNGLTITVKNIGTHKDFVTLKGSGSSVIDSVSIVPLPRWFSVTAIANGGNWNLKERTMLSVNTMEIGWTSSWQTVTQALEFLSEHMSGPVLIKLGRGSFNISETQVINLPYSVTIEGASFGTTTFTAATGLTNKAMFRCSTECYFKMLEFDGSTLSSYGTQSGEDAIQLLGSGTYHEVKDCNFNSFNKAIANLSNAELWFFESDVVNAFAAGVEMNSSSSGAIVKISEVDFTGCAKGINLLKGNSSRFSITNCGFYNALSGDIGINYVPATFSPFTSMFITNNTWNNIGIYMNGFDFSRSDGRDANAFIENNAGAESKNAHCKINVNNNSSSANVNPAGTWVKASWVNTSSTTTNWAISNNRITYQPINVRDAFMIITGDLSNDKSYTVSLAIVKNGVTSTRYGECDQRITTANLPFQFATTIYLEDIHSGDYFELYFTSSHNGDNITFQDVQWFTETK